MKNILVLGGGGFIGRNIVQSLLEKGDCIVTAADSRQGSNWETISKDKKLCNRFNAVIGDFTQFSAFENLDGNFDEVYMLAAVVGVNKTLKQPEEVIRTNTLLTMNTLKWISLNPIKKLLFSSTSENYAGTSELFNADIPTSEDVPLCIGDIMHPRWIYAVTKIHGESAFIHSSKAYNFECTIVRYHNIIGPEMGFSHVIPHIVERFSIGDESPFKIYGHDQTRAFCFIDDAVRGTINAMESSISNQEIYHIGTQEEVSIRSLTTFIGELMSYRGEYENAETYPGSVARRCPNIKKASDHFGYTPQIDWREAVKITVEWYKDYFSSGKRPQSGGFEPPEDVFSKAHKK